MESLYEISREYLAALENIEVDEETGEVLNLEALDAIEGSLNDKAENVTCQIKYLKAFSENIKAEIGELGKRRKSVDKKVERLTEYVITCLDGIDKKKLDTPRTHIRIHESTATLVDDISLVPAEYVKEKVEVSADKAAIKQAILAGEVIPGASLVTNRNLQIK